MARLDVLPSEAIDDPDLRKMMQETGGLVFMDTIHHCLKAS